MRKYGMADNCIWLAGFCAIVGTVSLVVDRPDFAGAAAEVGILWLLIGLYRMQRDRQPRP